MSDYKKSIESMKDAVQSATAALKRWAGLPRRDNSNLPIRISDRIAAAAADMRVGVDFAEGESVSAISIGAMERTYREMMGVAPAHPFRVFINRKRNVYSALLQSEHTYAVARMRPGAVPVGYIPPLDYRVSFSNEHRRGSDDYRWRDTGDRFDFHFHVGGDAAMDEFIFEAIQRSAWGPEGPFLLFDDIYYRAIEALYNRYGPETPLTLRNIDEEINRFLLDRYEFTIYNTSRIIRDHLKGHTNRMHLKGQTNLVSAGRYEIGRWAPFIALIALVQRTIDPDVVQNDKAIQRFWRLYHIIHAFPPFYVDRDGSLNALGGDVHISGDRLHNESGPALNIVPHRSQYYMRGIEVPGEAFEETAEIDLGTFRHIMSIRNQEVRRVLIHRVGWERLLESVQHTVIDEDEVPEIGRLIEVNAPPHQQVRVFEHWRVLGTDFKMRFIHVRNGTPEPDGSYEWFFLRVPESIETAWEGGAWTYPGLNISSRKEYLRYKRT